MARIIDMKTRQDLPSAPLSRTKRVVLAVKRRPERLARDELCVTVVRLAAAFEDVVSKPDQYVPALRVFCEGAIGEIDTLLSKLEVKA